MVRSGRVPSSRKEAKKATPIFSDLAQTFSLRPIKEISTEVSYLLIVALGSIMSLVVIVIKLLFRLISDEPFNVEYWKDYFIYSIVFIFTYNIFLFLGSYIYTALFNCRSYNRCIYILTLSVVYLPAFIAISTLINRFADTMYTYTALFISIALTDYIQSINFGHVFDLGDDNRTYFLLRIVNLIMHVMFLLVLIKIMKQF